MNVLSLFDGMSCGQIALERANIKIDNYFASEIDKYAIKVTQANYPDTIQLGDIRDWQEWQLSKIDLILAGSPCQGFSNAGKGLNFDDPRSALYFEFEKILEHYKPKHWLLENVKMKKEWQNVITERLGVEPVLINSSLVSAQHRQRLYWSNLEFGQPEELDIIIGDILEVPRKDMPWLSDKAIKRLERINKRAKKNNLGYKDCIRNNFDKYIGFDANYFKGADGKRGVVKQLDWFRMLTPLECERLQTVPDNYTNHVSNTQRYKMLGNGWTVDVIVHILQGIKKS